MSLFTNENGAPLPEESYEFAEERGEKEPFRVDNDSKADWALRRIAADRAEADRLIAIASEEIERYQALVRSIHERYERKTDYLKVQLESYFDTVPQKTTKTTAKYPLLSGTLVRKKGGTDYRRDNRTLVDWLEENDPDYIKTTKEPRWSELKAQLTFADGIAIAPSGEIVPGVTVVQKPDTFVIELAKEDMS